MKNKQFRDKKNAEKRIPVKKNDEERMRENTYWESNSINYWQNILGKNPVNVLV